MSPLMEKALTEINKLPEQEQEVTGQWLLQELNAEKEWQVLFDQSADMLEELAAEALAEHRRGETLPLDADTL
jgi:hypothetical protein